MNICVIGAGYVGLVTGACFSDFGVNVVCVDSDAAKVEMLRRGEIPIYEPGLKELVDKNAREGRLSFTTDLAGSLKKALVVFIAVGTPQGPDGSADLSQVEAAARTIARHLDGYKVIATKSTVPAGTGAKIEKIVASECPAGARFDVASNPEFLREGSAIEDFMRPNRVVIGASSQEAVAIMKDLYSPLYLIETPFVITDVVTAELIKYASNAFLAAKITFINEMANLCDKVGADVHVLAKGMGLDKRIGPKFLHPGPGYGGSCFPKDTVALSSIARSNGYEFRLVDAVVEVNKRQRGVMMDKIRALTGPLKGLTIAALGVTFKPNTDDVRESPAVDIINMLAAEGASVKTYDPAGMETGKAVVKGKVSFCHDPYEAVAGCDALVILTEWNQFRKLDMERVKGSMKRARLADLRNVYDPEAMRQLGFEYVCVGRR